LGLANRVFLRKAKFISLAFPIKGLVNSSSRVRLVGNPIAAKFFAAKNSKASELNILVTGGSQGADFINNLVAKILPELNRVVVNTKLHIKHITGKANYEKYLNAVPEHHGEFIDYEVIAYTHEMPELCHWADLAICRSGAMTIAEMAAAKVVPVFIPLPWAANDHQTLNAKYLVDAGAAYSLRQEDPELQTKLMQIIKDSIEVPSKLTSMQERLGAFANPKAAEELVELIVAANKPQ
jgi:UDP-N-acetylglucosamine--N-acetylmuramyl-(pentapeptide) pyrophosphoryl-undecaprenol N-acetylglucosamine transferase